MKPTNPRISHKYLSRLFFIICLLLMVVASAQSIIASKIFQNNDDDEERSSNSYFDLNNSEAWNNVPAWNSSGHVGTVQSTTDLSTIVHEIVNRGGWLSGSSTVSTKNSSREPTIQSFSRSIKSVSVTITEDNTPFIRGKDIKLAKINFENNYANILHTDE